MLQGGDIRFGDAIASALGWWAEAGVDTPVDETPRDWLARPKRPEAPLAPVLASDVLPSAPDGMPDTLEAFRAWLADGAIVSGAAPPRRRVGSFGDPAGGLMVVADMPDPGDGPTLFTGETAALFGAMMAAIGRTRATLYAAPLCPWRVPGGRIEPGARASLAALMRRHIALVAPRALLILGDEAGLALAGEPGAANPSTRIVNHDGGTVRAVTIFHPRFLRRHPAAKAVAWTGLRLLNGVFA